MGAGEGAFGHLAQLLALIGLFAGLVSLREGPPSEAPPSEAPTRRLPRTDTGEGKPV